MNFTPTHQPAPNPMRGEGALINLMHTRYVEGVLHICAMMTGTVPTDRLELMAKHLSDSNVNYYVHNWQKEPSPQKIPKYVNSCWQLVEKKKG